MQPRKSVVVPKSSAAAGGSRHRHVMLHATTDYSLQGDSLLSGIAQINSESLRTQILSIFQLEVSERQRRLSVCRLRESLDYELTATVVPLIKRGANSRQFIVILQSRGIWTDSACADNFSHIWRRETSGSASQTPPSRRVKSHQRKP